MIQYFKTFALRRGLQASFAFFLAFLLSSPSAKATHAMGADLTYSCLGNDQYRVTLTVYRDCNGINLTPNADVRIQSATCGFNFVASLPNTDMEEITPVCPGVVGSACQNTGIYGIQR